MTTELMYLALAALLTHVLWIPYIVMLSTTTGSLTPEEYANPDLKKPSSPLLVRLNRAHMNSVETLAPFAVLVILLHLTEQSSTITVVCAAVFFWSRLAHAVVYAAGIPYVRTGTFTVGFLAALGLAWELFM